MVSPGARAGMDRSSRAACGSRRQTVQLSGHPGAAGRLRESSHSRSLSLKSLAGLRLKSWFSGRATGAGQPISLETVPIRRLGERPGRDPAHTVWAAALCTYIYYCNPAVRIYRDYTPAVCRSPQPKSSWRRYVSRYAPGRPALNLAGQGASSHRPMRRTARRCAIQHSISRTQTHTETSFLSSRCLKTSYLCRVPGGSLGRRCPISRWKRPPYLMGAGGGRLT